MKLDKEKLETELAGVRKKLRKLDGSISKEEHDKTTVSPLLGYPDEPAE